MLIRDISERVAAEKSLRESEDRYRDLFESAIDVVLVVRAQGDILDINRGGSQLTGYSRDQLRSFNVIEDLVVEPDREIIEEVLVDVTAGVERTYEVRWRTRTGEVIVFEGATSSRRDDRGRLLWTRCTLRDITRRKHEEQQLRDTFQPEHAAVERLREIDRMKTAFVRSISHALRTPLTVVVGIAAVLKRRVGDLLPDRTAHLAQRLWANAQRLERLLGDVLDLDRLLRGTERAHRRPTRLDQVVRNTVESVGAHDHQLSLDLESVTMTVDAATVERILEHLLDNATRHTPPDTRIWIHLHRTGEGAQLTVEDDGPGIPAAHRDAVFPPFRHGADIELRASPGTGLGLSLVAHFAALHGGRAWAEPRPVVEPDSR